MRCGRHSANLPPEDLGREEAAFLAFQNEVRLMLQVLRRKKKTDHKPLAKRGCNFETPVVQDVKGNRYTQASDCIWKHRGTIQTGLQAAQLE
jgi:hypothetical protein